MSTAKKGWNMNMYLTFTKPTIQNRTPVNFLLCTVVLLYTIVSTAKHNALCLATKLYNSNRTHTMGWPPLNLALSVLHTVFKWMKNVVILNIFFTYCGYNSSALSNTRETFSDHIPFHSIKSLEAGYLTNHS
jgi:hypothetical protein